MEKRREVMTDCLGGLYSVPGAARRLGISYDCLDSRIRRGEVMVVRVGNERFVSLDDPLLHRVTRPEERAS